MSEEDLGLDSRESIDDVGQYMDDRSYSTHSVALSNEDQSEHEGMKLFVGQLPKTMEEGEIRSFFESFGPISEVVVLRDKLTGVHKGIAACQILISA